MSVQTPESPRDAISIESIADRIESEAVDFAAESTIGGLTVVHRALGVVEGLRRIAMQRQIVDAEVVDTRVADLEATQTTLLKTNNQQANRIWDLETELAERSTVAYKQQARIDATYNYLQSVREVNAPNAISALIAKRALRHLSEDGVVDEPIVDGRVAELEAEVRRLTRELADKERLNNGLQRETAQKFELIKEQAEQLADEKRCNGEHMRRIGELDSANTVLQGSVAARRADARRAQNRADRLTERFVELRTHLASVSMGAVLLKSDFAPIAHVNRAIDILRRGKP